MFSDYPDFGYTLRFVQNIIPLLAPKELNITSDSVAEQVSNTFEEISSMRDQGVINEEFYRFGGIKALEDDMSPGERIAEKLRGDLLEVMGEADSYESGDIAYLTDVAQREIKEKVDAYYTRGITFMSRLVKFDQTFKRLPEVGRFTREMIKVTAPHFIARGFISEHKNNPFHVPDVADLKKSLKELTDLLSMVGSGESPESTEELFCLELKKQSQPRWFSDSLNNYIDEKITSKPSKKRLGM